MEFGPAKQEKPTAEKDPTLERCANIIEQAKKERSELAIDVLKRLTSIAINISPLGTVKMGAEIYFGKKATGETFTTPGKVLHGLVIASSLTCWSIAILAAYKKDPDALKLAGMFWANTTALMGIETCTEIMQEAKKLAKKYDMKSLHEILVKSEEAIKKLSENGNNGTK